MRRLPTLSLSEFARFRGSAFGKIALVVITTIPALYGGLMVWSYLDPTNRLNDVPAAVVNQDEPVTITDADGNEQVVPLGRTLAGELTSSDAADNYGWVLTDAEDAAAGLEDGTYAAVLTIPEDFSANATSASGDDPAAARQAVLSVQTNDASNYVTGNITRLIAEAVTRTLSETVSQTYLKNVYVGFTTIHDQLTEANDGATRLADGATRLLDGAVRLDTGSADLASGLATLSGGAAALADGNARLADGAATLASGLATLDTQAADLPAQARQLADGATRLADGADQLATGAHQLDAAAVRLADGTATLAAGSGELASGLGDLQTRTAALPDQATALDRSTRQILAAVQDQLATGADDLATGAGRLKDGVDAYTGALASVCATLEAQPTPDPRLAGLCDPTAGLVAQNATLQVGAAQVATGAAVLSHGISESTDPAQPSLLASLQALQQQGTGPLAVNAPAITAAIGELAAGAGQLAAGTDELATGAGRLADGTGQLASGAGQMVAGTGQLVAGTGQLSTAAPRLTDAIDQAASGAATLSAGATNASQGADSLANGAGEVESGARRLADGAGELLSGTGDLDSGARELVDGLAGGLEQVPTYTDQEATHLSEVAAAPVTDELTRLNQVASNGYGFAPYFMSLAAWIGAMALYMILRALPRRAIASTAPSWRVALAGFAPGAALAVVQALLMVVVVRFAVGVEAANLPGLVVFALFMGLCFTAINQALVAAFGTAGRFVGLVLIALQLTSAGATYPIGTTPGFFQALHPFLPLSHSVQAIRGLIAGGDTGLVTAYVVLGIWMVGALTVSLLAARKQQKWTVDRLHPELVL